MKKVKINQKFHKLKETINKLKYKTKLNEKDIHKLRTSCREILSLLDKKSKNYKTIKLIIKFSNSIRDIDVFLNYYLEQLTSKELKNINVTLLKKKLSSFRKRKSRKFLNFLKTIKFTKEILLTKEKKTRVSDIESFIKNIDKIKTSQKLLHKKRIIVKEQLYIEKNNMVKNLSKITVLKSIKNELGYINDNFNGMDMLKSKLKSKNIIKKIEIFTHNKNLIHIKNIKEIYEK